MLPATLQDAELLTGLAKAPGEGFSMAGVSGVNQAVLVERVNRLLETIEAIQKGVDKIECGQAEFVLAYTKDKAVIENRVTNNEVDIKEIKSRLADLESTIKKLHDSIGPLIWANRILAGIGSLLLAAVFYLVWGLATGQYTIVEKVISP
jgi:hypothetical protein